MGETKMKILVIGTGGIAASKLPSICSALSTYNHYHVDVMLTDKAWDFVTRESLQYSVDKIWTEADYMAHIKSTQDISKLIIVPATANIIEKIAHGAADDLVSSTCVKRNTHLTKIIFPAMNPDMYDNPPVQRNIRQVLRDGWIVVEPAIGRAACGDYGRGVLRSTKDIVRCVNNLKIKRKVKINKEVDEKCWYYKFRGEIFNINHIKKEMKKGTNNVDYADYTVWIDPYDERLKGKHTVGCSYPVNLNNCKIINMAKENMITGDDILSM